MIIDIVISNIPNIITIPDSDIFPLLGRFKVFWTDFTIGAGQKCRETDKRAKNKGSRADLNKKSDCFSGNSAKN